MQYADLVVDTKHVFTEKPVGRKTGTNSRSTVQISTESVENVQRVNDIRKVCVLRSAVDPLKVENNYEFPLDTSMDAFYDRLFTSYKSNDIKSESPNHGYTIPLQKSSFSRSNTINKSPPSKSNLFTTYSPSYSPVPFGSNFLLAKHVGSPTTHRPRKTYTRARNYEWSPKDEEEPPFLLEARRSRSSSEVTILNLNAPKNPHAQKKKLLLEKGNSEKQQKQHEDLRDAISVSLFSNISNRKPSIGAITQWDDEANSPQFLADSELLAYVSEKI
jgi:hypothetical protein